MARVLFQRVNLPRNFMKVKKIWGVYLMITVRGAITVEKNERTEVLEKTKTMLSLIFLKNNIKTEDILSILFTATSDIDCVYPAASARELGITQASLMCMQEMKVVGSLEKCIRVMVMAESDLKQKDVKHIYLEGAKKLRPDLSIN